VPIRCAGGLYLNAKYGEPWPTAKCDAGLSFTSPDPNCIGGAVSWQSVVGTTAPMNAYQKMGQSGVDFVRCDGGTSLNKKIVLSETYVHMWDPDLSYAGVGTTDRTEGGTVTATGSPCIAQDGPSNAFDNAFSSTSGTRWCLAVSTGSIMYAMSASRVITGYSVTSANYGFQNS